LRDEGNIFKNLDWASVILYTLLVFLGWINIYAAVFNEDQPSILDTTQKYGKQMIWIAGAFLLIVVIMFIDGRIYERFSIPIYIIVVLLLVGVLLFGKEVKGARSWFAFGGFSLQPSEFAKFATSLAIAHVLSLPKIDMKKWLHRFYVLGLIVLPAGLIALQPDMGSALVYAAFILVMYREGVPGYYLFLAFWLAALFVLSLVIPQLWLIGSLVGISLVLIFFLRKNKQAIWLNLAALAMSIIFVFGVDYIFNNVLATHQQSRFKILLGLEEDPSGAGYNTHQSLIAIGSGGFKGKGFLQGTQTKFDFVPEQSTDYIFCTIGEEWGFIGTTVVVVLFIALLFRIVVLAERQKSDFARIYGYCVASIIFVHVAINIAMVIGLAPVIGIPLPFFSYGGSSLWGFTILVFIFLRMDSFRWQIL
jgi:rod shape determining protein RodA